MELTIVLADTPTLLNILASHDEEPQVDMVDIYTRLTNLLVSAVAASVAVPSIARHFCIGDFKMKSPLPMVDRISNVNRVVQTRGLKRIGIPGTRAVMETGFCGAIPGVTISPPVGDDLDQVHQSYVSMAGRRLCH